KKIWNNFSAMMQKGIVYIPIIALLVLGALIPGLGIIAAILGVFLLTYELFDFSFDACHMTFKQRIAFIKAHLGLIVGWSTALGLTTLIPGINILIMPGSVVSAAWLFYKLKEE